VTPAGAVPGRSGWWAPALLALLVTGSTAATILAMRQTSATFDEITTIAVGARGWHTGDWTMMPDYPPVTQYLYGLPAYLSGPRYPAETDQRYVYARNLLWRSGNDGATLIFRGRLVAAAAVAVLVLLTFFFAQAYFGTTAGLIAAAIVGFLPDVLAHGGVAYNDIMLAPAFLAGLWALDVAVRRPSIPAGLRAGLLISLALGIKHSALALGPVAVVLIVAELLARPERRAWLGQVALAAMAALVAGYLFQVLLYRGDFALGDLRASTLAASQSIGAGRGAYLLGVTRADSWWYFYPVALLFKTPVAFHLLLLLALLGAARAAGAHTARTLLTSAARAPLIALLVFGLVLVRANLVIGFRYALPLLPLLAVLAAAGCAVLWRQSRGFQAATAALLLWSAASTLSFYPHFLAYTSEHQPDRDRGWEVFVDSSLDWGQGLIALREFMKEEGESRVYLAYFGSAVPDGYGIDYIALPSYPPLEPRSTPEVDAPRFMVVSATLLVGHYLNNDFYAQLRDRQPYRVLARTLNVYEAQ
jgi:hypothetical protein